MKFNITLKSLTNELRNYLALGFTFIGHIFYIPTAICDTISKILRVD